MFNGLNDLLPYCVHVGNHIRITRRLCRVERIKLLWGDYCRHYWMGNRNQWLIYSIRMSRSQFSWELRVLGRSTLPGHLFYGYYRITTLSSSWPFCEQIFTISITHTNTYESLRERVNDAKRVLNRFHICIYGRNTRHNRITNSTNSNDGHMITISYFEPIHSLAFAHIYMPFALNHFGRGTPFRNGVIRSGSSWIVRRTQRTTYDKTETEQTKKNVWHVVSFGMGVEAVSVS